MIYLVESIEESEHIISIENRCFSLKTSVKAESTIRYMKLEKYKHDYYDLEFGNLVRTSKGLFQKTEYISDKFGYSVNNLLNSIVRSKLFTEDELYSLIIPSDIILYIANKLLLNSSSSVYYILSNYLKEYFKHEYVHSGSKSF